MSAKKVKTKTVRFTESRVSELNELSEIRRQMAELKKRKDKLSEKIRKWLPVGSAYILEEEGIEISLYTTKKTRFDKEVAKKMLTNTQYKKCLTESIETRLNIVELKE